MSLFPEYTTVNNDVQQEEFYEIIWPISAPGVALPGPDFAAYAEALEPDQSVVIKGSGNKAKLISYPDVLQELYERSLFEPRFTLPVKNKGVEYQAEFLPGHIWDNRPPELDNEAPTDIASLGEDQTLKLLYGPPEEGCDVMVVGKMPGYEDVANGVNMYGPIGKLFKDALDSLGVVDSGDWYITNLIKFAKVDSRTDAIPQSFIKDCLPTLQLEMRLVKPKYMLLLGAEAVTWVLGKGQKLANTVGEVFEHTIDLRKDSTEAENTHTIKVMTCSNPGRVLRSPDLRPQFVEELRMFTELLKGKEVGRAEKDLEHHIVSDETTLEALVSRILKEPYNNVIAVDAEWHGEHPFEPGAYPRSIQFSHKGKPARIFEAIHRRSALARRQALQHGANGDDGHRLCGIQQAQHGVVDKLVPDVAELPPVGQHLPHIVGHVLPVHRLKDAAQHGALALRVLRDQRPAHSSTISRAMRASARSMSVSMRGGLGFGGAPGVPAGGSSSQRR